MWMFSWLVINIKKISLTFFYGKAINVHQLFWLCPELVGCQTVRVYFYLDTVIIN